MIVQELGVMEFNATFNNISVISWCSILLVKETRGPGENHQHVTSHWQTLSYNVVSRTSCHKQDSNSLFVVSSNPAHGKMYSI